jgi:hypothetical protein
MGLNKRQKEREGIGKKGRYLDIALFFHCLVHLPQLGNEVIHLNDPVEHSSDQLRRVGIITSL